MFSRFTIQFLLIFISFISVAYSQQHIFFNYSLDEGLPQASIISIYQDSTGNMWFGTQGGVSKYNGNSFVNYDTRHGLGDNHITAMLQDSHGKYWFGHRYNGVTTMHYNKFRHYNFTNQQIMSIMEDKYGNLWFGTLQKGLYLLPYDYNDSLPHFIRLDMQLEYPQMDVFDIVEASGDMILVASWDGLSVITTSDSIGNINLQHFSDKNSDLPFNTILSIARESKQFYWLLGYHGIARIKIEPSQKISQVSYYPFKGDIKISSVNNIVMDKNHMIWGTYDTGIFRFSKGMFDFDFRGTGYRQTKTYSVFCDKEENLWIGTMDLGAFKYTNDKFIVFDQSSGLLNNVITSVIRDQRNNIWIATEGGICIWNGKKYKYLTNKDVLRSNSTNVIFEDSRGNIWIGDISRDPLIRYNPDTDNFRYFSASDGIPSSSVITVNEDPDGNIWFASLWDSPFRYTYPGQGKPEKFRSFTTEDGLCSNSIWVIHRDLKGNLWFGSDDAGLTKFDGINFTTYGEQDGLTNPSSGGLANDSRNNLWIASIGGGIYKFDGKKFTNYSISDGLSSDSPFSIICDNNDLVWVGTNTGIDRFDPIHKVFKHYGKSDGFTGIENNQNAVFKDKSGLIWFGTIHGLIRFDPKLDIPNMKPPITVIENVDLFYNRFDYSKYTDSIDNFTGLPIGLQLSYKKNHITFGYVGVSHISPDKIAYQYKLENFDEKWNPVTRMTFATYTNIPPGDYTFMVKAANNDGIWDPEPAALSFTILPPVWQTAWFRFIAVIFTGGLVYLTFWWRFRSIRAQKMRLETLVNEKTTELKQEADQRRKAQLKAEESDKLKTAFLANMSHEIRTPVNAIVGFADLMKDKSLKEDDKNTYLNYIIGGGKTLLTLINDIIDISKIEAGQVRISRDVCNVGTLISELYMTFNEELKKRSKTGIELKYAVPSGFAGLELYTDPFRLKQVLSNLLGNAIKFTDDGYIEFGFTVVDARMIEFFVKDTGIGIPPDKMEVIFQRFRQVEESYTRNFEGTGLGLAISRKLIGLMEGEMWVESTQGEGSAFYFSLPFEPVNGTAEFKQPAKGMNGNSLKNRKILIVEDEDSNYLLIESMLANYGPELIHVKDGSKAIEIFIEQADDIDLVLMDIKIPGLNGYEATREIKKIKSSVPVIAQTAYAVSGEKDKCLEAGCDDYIAKPYNKDELIGIIQRHLLNGKSPVNSVNNIVKARL